MWPPTTSRCPRTANARHVESQYADHFRDLGLRDLAYASPIEHQRGYAIRWIHAASIGDRRERARLGDQHGRAGDDGLALRRHKHVAALDGKPRVARTVGRHEPVAHALDVVVLDC